MLTRLKLALSGIVCRSSADQSIDDELRFHLESSAQLLEQRGLSRDEAWAQALRQFGNVTFTKEESLAQQRVRLLDDLWADLRYAVRALRRTPAFTVVAVATIAIGVGANTAIVSAIDALMVKNMPVDHPERLVYLDAIGARGQEFGGPPYPWFEQIRARARSLEGAAAFSTDQLPISIDGRLEQVMGQVASGSYFDVLGVHAAIGRTLRPEDERLSPPVAVISHRYWLRRFGGNPNAIGTIVRYGDHSLTIVGVTAPGFDGLEVGHPVEITMPITLAGYDLLQNSQTWWSQMIARVKPTVSLPAAEAELGAIYSSIDEKAKTKAANGLPSRRLAVTTAARGVGAIRHRLSSPFFLLLGAAAAVLLIGCANIANLLSVRAASRRRELAVRRALGAGAGRLTRQLLTESIVLFVLGGAAGLIVTSIVQHVIAAYFAIGRNPIILPLSLDARVLIVSAVLALVSGLAAGLAPALRARSSTTHAFADLRMASGRALGATAVSRTLVIFQVAISAVVLVDGSLLVRTLLNLQSVDVGFEPRRVLTVSIQPLESTYPGDARARVFTDVLDRVRREPSIESASLSVLTPLSGRDRGRDLTIAGRSFGPNEEHGVHLNVVSSDYFRTFGIPMKVGRAFNESDDPAAPTVAVMNAAAARYFFAAASPLGTPISIGPEKTTYTIVGETGDTKHMNLREMAPRFVYFPLEQSKESPGRLTLSVRTRTDVSQAVDVIRRAVGDVGKDILISDIETASQQIDRALLKERLVSSLSLVFAALGVLLAALGLYGVMAYSVLRRTDEIGLRMALGSPPRAIRWLMVREAMTMGTIGVVVGIPVTLATSGAIQKMLYNVAPHDPAIVGACAVSLLIVTAIAAYLPAHRASRIDPVRALAAQ